MNPRLGTPSAGQGHHHSTAHPLPPPWQVEGISVNECEIAAIDVEPPYKPPAPSGVPVRSSGLKDVASGCGARARRLHSHSTAALVENEGRSACWGTVNLAHPPTPPATLRAEHPHHHRCASCGAQLSSETPSRRSRRSKAATRSEAYACTCSGAPNKSSSSQYRAPRWVPS